MTRFHDAALLDSSRYDVYGRLLIEGILLDDVLGYNPLIRADWSHSINQLAATGTIALHLDRASGLASPLGDAAPRGGKSFILQSATVPKGILPASADYRPVFDGRIDDFDRTGGEDVTLFCRDRMAFLLNRRIKPSPSAWGFTSGGSSLLTTVNQIQQTAFGGALPYPILQGSDPEWTVTEFFQDAGMTVAEAVQAKVLQRAWGFHYRYHDIATLNYPGLHLIYDPDTIGGEAVDIGPRAMLRILKLAAGTVDIRNFIELMWGRETRTRSTMSDAASIDRYQEAYEMLTEDKTSQIDTEEEAERMLAGALAQQKDPVIDLDYERFFYWPVQLCDAQRIQANGYHFDFSFTVTVVGYSHSLTPRQMRSTLRTRGGSAVSASRLWRKNDPKMIHVSLAGPTGIAPEYALHLQVDDLTPPDVSSETALRTVPVTTAPELLAAMAAALPGDEIRLAAGTYTGVFQLEESGTAANRIFLRALPGVRAILDGAGTVDNTSTLVIDADYVTVWGLEVMNSDTDRTTAGTEDLRPNAVVNQGSHNRYVNVITHDAGVGFFNDPGAIDVELSGCIAYNHGWESTADGSHGPGFYLKSDVGPVTLKRCVSFNNNRLGIQGFTSAGSGAALANIHLIENASFNNGHPAADGPRANIQLGGEQPVSGGEVRGNVTLHAGTTGPNLRIGTADAGGTDVAVEDNLVIGGGTGLEIYPFTAPTVRNNRVIGDATMVEVFDTDDTGTVWGGNEWARSAAATAWDYDGVAATFADWQTASGLGPTDSVIATPTAQQVVVWPDPWEIGRAAVVVYNPSEDAEAVATVPALVGLNWTVHHVFDLWGTPVATGSGSTVTIPLAEVAAPVFLGEGSANPAPAIGPDFGVFIVRPV